MDFLVDFEPIADDTFDYVSNYFSLRDTLERIFGHRVDLIEENGLRDKYFIDGINRTKRILYNPS